MRARRNDIGLVCVDADERISKALFEELGAYCFGVSGVFLDIGREGDEHGRKIKGAAQRNKAVRQARELPEGSRLEAVPCGEHDLGGQPIAGGSEEHERLRAVQHIGEAARDGGGGIDGGGGGGAAAGTERGEGAQHVETARQHSGQLPRVLQRPLVRGGAGRRRRRRHGVHHAHVRLAGAQQKPRRVARHAIAQCRVDENLHAHRAADSSSGFPFPFLLSAFFAPSFLLSPPLRSSLSASVIPTAQQQ